MHFWIEILFQKTSQFDTHSHSRAKHVDPVSDDDDDDDARARGTKRTIVSTTIHRDAMRNGNREPLDDTHDGARWKTRGVVGAVHDGIDDGWGGARGGDVQPTDRLVV